MGRAVRRAAKVDANQARIVAALRQTGVEVMSLAAVGNGCPDLICCRGGNLTMLEIKHEKRGRLTPHQKSFHQRWPVAVVTNELEALRAVGVI